MPGMWELLVIAGIIILLFGARRLPEIGKSLGLGLREFKDSISGKNDEDRTPSAPPRVEHDKDDPSRPE